MMCCYVIGNLFVLVQTLFYPFFADVLKGVNEKAQDLAGYNCSVLVKQIPINVDTQLRAIDELLREEVSGIAPMMCCYVIGNLFVLVQTLFFLFINLFLL